MIKHPTILERVQIIRSKFWQGARVIFITGRQGSGKTQTAKAYIHDTEGSYDFVYLIEDRKSLSKYPLCVNEFAIDGLIVFDQIHITDIDISEFLRLSDTIRFLICLEDENDLKVG